MLQLGVGVDGDLPEWPYGREGSIDRRMQFMPVEPPQVVCTCAQSWSQI